MTLDASGQGTCPRCGANVGEAPWCPSCGLNLRLHTAETAAQPPSAPTSAPAPAQRNPRRRRLVAVIAGVLVLGGASAAVAVLAFRSSSPRDTAAAKTVVVTDVVTDGNPVTPPTVTVDEMHNVLLGYVQAYSDESVVELESLFAPDLVRRNGDDPVEHRDAALATYQQQFDQLSDPQYQLSGLHYSAVPGEGTAEGGYVITSSAGQSRGRIIFVFEVRGGHLLINGIRVIPS